MIVVGVSMVVAAVLIVGMKDLRKACLVVPVLMVGGLFVTNYLSWDSLQTSFGDKGDLLVLVLVFCYLMEGLRGTGYFRSVAFRVLGLCKRERDLVLAMFIAVGVLGYLFSKDVVILVMTPVVLVICERVKNLDKRFFLVSMFLAAHVCGMGLVTGPPKNLIVARAWDMDFFAYALWMVVPSLVLLLVGIAVTSMLLGRDEKQLVYERFEPVMVDGKVFRWFALYGAVVIFVMVNTFVELSYYWAALAVIPVFSLRRLGAIPWHILVFGLGFFACVEEFSHYVGVITWDGDPLVVSLAWVFGSALAANLVNDLPAAALGASLAGSQDPLLAQALLSGLGIGSYLTPVGTLAAVIWFHLLARSGETVRKRDLSALGGLHFVCGGIIVSVVLGALHGSLWAILGLILLLGVFIWRFAHLFALPWMRILFCLRV